MGELQGRPNPDRPEDRPQSTPPDLHRPTPRVEVRPAVTPRPAPGPADVLLNPRTSRDRPPPRKPETPDGPAHRAPDLIPPSGEELAKMDAPGASRIERARKSALDQETLSDSIDSLKEAGHTWDGAISKPPGPTHAYVEARSRHATMFETPHYGVGTGDTLTGMFVGGILLGEGTRWAYRKLSEMKEMRHARDR